MPTTIFHNGKFHVLDASNISAADPGSTHPLQLISPFDAGFTHAVGLFETINAGLSPQKGPWAFQLSRHLRRLASSAQALSLLQTINTGALAEAVLETIRQANLPRARVRLTLTPGDLSLLPAHANSSSQPNNAANSPQRHPTILIHAQPATAYPDQMFDLGVTVTIADARANNLNPLESHKTLNYWWRLRELQLAGKKHAAEAIVANTDNTLASGCVSNLFLVKHNQLHTPPTRDDIPHPASSKPSATLPGTTRRHILDLADDQHIPVHIRPLTVHDLLDADEAFLTNASWGVLPIAAIEAHQLPQAPGPLTHALRNDYLGSLAAWQDDHHAAETALAERDNHPDGPGSNAQGQPDQSTDSESWIDPSARRLASQIDEELEDE